MNKCRELALGQLFFLPQIRWIAFGWDGESRLPSMRFGLLLSKAMPLGGAGPKSCKSLKSKKSQLTLPPMIEKLEEIKHRFEEVGQLIVQPDAISDMKKYS